jgi:hypothetical protein
VHLVILPRANVFVSVGLNHRSLTIFFASLEVA